MESLHSRQSGRPWMVSMHGGHSNEYCDHASNSLREILGAAVSAGYHTFGVTEHAPRAEARFLYPNERQLGWSVGKTVADFETYIGELPEIADEFKEELNVVIGFEAEVVPSATYVESMLKYRRRLHANGTAVFDYCVGSVHHVGEIQIDGDPEQWLAASEAAGGPESLAAAYYQTVRDMVDALKPEVVGHLDLIKRNAITAGFDFGVVSSGRVRIAACEALEAIRANHGILDLNTAGWRKGLGEPYPAPWIIKLAAAMEIPFCFGDDSHSIVQVGEGVEPARQYLLQQGVDTITYIRHGGERSLVSLVK